MTGVGTMDIERLNEVWLIGEKLARIDAEGGGKPLDDDDGWSALTPFDPAHVSSVHPYKIGEGIL